jgi:hypothetical protein
MLSWVQIPSQNIQILVLVSLNEYYHLILGDTMTLDINIL